MENKRGFILILTFALMVTLILMVAGLLYMTSVSMKDIGAVTTDYKLLNLADAGVQRAQRAIEDRTVTQGVADLRGAAASGTASNVNRICYIDGSYATVASDTAVLNGFDSNYANTSIIAISIVAVAGRQTDSGQQKNATLQVSYSIRGVIGAAKLIQDLPNATKLVTYSQPITGDRAWSWADILDPAGNFTLTATRTAGSRNIRLDAIYLNVAYQVGWSGESWATGSYATFPITLGSGKIQSISITDEQGKAHLNTASQILLSYLMQELGIAAATANTLAANMVAYRTTKPFDSVEELQRVSGMTPVNYNLIKDYVTVYSFINPYAQRAAGARAPININTASRQVLEAIFDPLGLGAGDPASLAGAIISFRAVQPFACLYSTSSTSDFYDFVMAQSYLKTAEKRLVLDNADASLLVPVSGAAAYNCVTTEFSYDANIFNINSLADVNGRRFRVKTISPPAGYRKENFE